MMRLTVTLLDGASHSFDVETVPQHWKSWVMHQLPYGTNFGGCTWKHEAVK